MELLEFTLHLTDEEKVRRQYEGEHARVKSLSFIANACLNDVIDLAEYNELRHGLNKNGSLLVTESMYARLSKTV
jgi:hypothetical protein